MDLLRRISQEILEAATVGVDEEVISRQLDVVKERRNELEQRRLNLVDAAKESFRSTNDDHLTALGEHLAALRREREARATEVSDILTQIADTEEFSRAVEAEVARLGRARESGAVLSPLRITHCPACQQSVQPPNIPLPDSCWLCRQSLADSGQHPSPDGEGSGAEARFKFEFGQLDAEGKESHALLHELRRELDMAQRRSRELDEEIFFVDSQLKPARSALTALLPQEVFSIERELGQLDQREQQWLRMRRTLSYREELTAKIAALESSINVLDASVRAASKSIDYERAEDLLANGVNEYLHLLNEVRPKAWSQPEVSVDLGRNSFQFRVGKQRWTKLGGTLSLYFLIAYGYSLLRLSGKSPYHYPGLLLLDLPATLDDGTKAADYERFAAEPFLVRRLNDEAGLLTTKHSPAWQVVFAGRAFSGLAEANVIRLHHVWRISE